MKSSTFCLKLPFNTKIVGIFKRKKEKRASDGKCLQNWRYIKQTCTSKFGRERMKGWERKREWEKEREKVMFLVHVKNTMFFGFLTSNVYCRVFFKKKNCWWNTFDTYKWKFFFFGKCYSVQINNLYFEWERENVLRKITSSISSKS